METLQIFILVMILLLVISMMYMYYKLKPSEDKTFITSTILPGTIVMWDSNVAPKGWAICDGSQGTPDLTGKFVAGAGASTVSGETMYELHAEGGENFHSLTADENGPHTHTTKTGAQDATYSGGNNFTYNGNSTTGSSGLGKPHENRPPFLALTYIMKL